MAGHSNKRTGAKKMAEEQKGSENPVNEEPIEVATDALLEVEEDKENGTERATSLLTATEKRMTVLSVPMLKATNKKEKRVNFGEDNGANLFERRVHFNIHPKDDDDEEEDEPETGSPRALSAPCAIALRDRMRYPFGTDEDDVYVGSYRDLGQFDLLKAPQGLDLLESYARVYKFLYEKLNSMKETRDDVTSKLIMLMSDDSTLYYFDEETVTLIPEEDYIKLYWVADVDPENERNVPRLESPIRTRNMFINYEGLMSGRHRRSANESVHPRHLGGLASRSIRFFPQREGLLAEYADEDEGDFYLDCTHPHYMKALPFMVARRRALEDDVTALEEELRKGSRMDVSVANEVIRQYYIPREDLPCDDLEF